MNEPKRSRYSDVGMRAVWAIEENPSVVAWAQTPWGKTGLLLVSFVTLLTARDWQASLFLLMAMALFAHVPAWRSRVLFVSTYATAFFFSSASIDESINEVVLSEGYTQLSPVTLSHVALVGFIALAWGLMAYARRYKKSVIAQRPVLTLLALECLLCVLSYRGVFSGYTRLAIWCLLSVFTPYFWFLAYALVDQRSKDRSSDLFQLGTFHPAWTGPTSTPMGKGAGFLRKVLAKTPQALAITQLKGVKLLLWEKVLVATSVLLTWLCEKQLHIPSLSDAIDAFLQNHAYTLGMEWAALIWSVTAYTLQIAIYGHFVIGVARMAGFQLPRSTWRVLESRTLIEYFNRFHYYFKELLVDFFFIPTFFSVFKKKPRLRLFFATFMAAGVGNALFHFMREIELLETMGLGGMLETYTSYLFYCVVLATGIGISQVRANAGYIPSPSVWGRVQSFVVVWGFVTLLHIFSDESRNHTLSERMHYLVSLFVWF
jgi:hypothetical protein